MSKPRIGVTCSPLRGPAYYGAYLRAVEAAGGEPVTLDPQPNGLPSDEAVAMIHGIDGLLVPGGWDVDPPAYGEARQEETPDVDAPLDLTEIALVRAAVDEGVPVFGICRGQQVINVALGGSLVSTSTVMTITAIRATCSRTPSMSCPGRSCRRSPPVTTSW